MKVKDVRERVAALKAMAENDGDDEKCHAAEDELWYDVLLAIAHRQVSDPGTLAHEATQTKHIDFQRNCA